MRHSFILSQWVFRPVLELPHGNTVPLSLAHISVCQIIVRNQWWLPVWQASQSMVEPGGGCPSWTLPLTDVFMLLPPLEVLLSHHSGITGEQRVSRAVLHEHIPSARVCHAGRGRHCWNVVWCVCVCHSLCVSHLPLSAPVNAYKCGGNVAKRLGF